MASTYSPLKIELIGTGEQGGTWGVTTNTNLGTALEEAITGRATATFPSDANFTLTYTDSNASQVFRNLVLNVTSSGNLSATRDLIIPAIEKQYFVENNTSGSQSIRVKTAAGTGVTIPNGKIANVYCDGTNVRFADNTVGDLAISNGTVSAPSLAAAADTNTGLYFPAADQVALTANGNQIVRAAHNGTKGTLTASGDVLIGAGTVVAPSLASSSDTDTGIYFPTTSAMAVAVSGIQMMIFDATRTISPSTEYVAFKRSVWAPAPDCGVLDIGRVSPAVGGSAISTIGSSTFLNFQIEDFGEVWILDNGFVGIGTGAPAVKLHLGDPPGEPVYVRTDNGNAYMDLGVAPAGGLSCIGHMPPGQIMTVGAATSSNYTIITSNTERIRVTAAGNVGINVASDPTDKLTVIGSSTGSSTSTVNFRNSSSTELLRIRDDGVFYTGSATFSPYNNTTGSAANVFIGASGDLYRSTSSIKYKTEVTNYDKGLAAVMAMRPVYYKDNRTDANKLPGDQRFAGLIAEEVHAAGLQEFVQYNAQNEPDALSYGNMAALFTKAIQELKAELDAVKAELAAMKGN